MGATTEGNRKAHQTLKERLGEDGYRAHMAMIGARGGKAYVAKGFAVTGKQFNIGSTRRVDHGGEEQ
jgi:hypothetical protein